MLRLKTHQTNLNIQEFNQLHYIAFSFHVAYGLYNVSALPLRLSDSMFRRVHAATAKGKKKMCHSVSWWQLSEDRGHRDAAVRSQRVKSETARSYLTFTDACNLHVTLSRRNLPHSACIQRKGDQRQWAMHSDIRILYVKDDCIGISVKCSPIECQNLSLPAKYKFESKNSFAKGEENKDT